MKASVVKIPVLFLVLQFCIITTGAGQMLPDTAQSNLSTPQQTIITHLGFLQEDNYHPEIAARAFARTWSDQESQLLSQQQDQTISEERAIELAIKVKQILDGRGIYIDITEVPANPNYIDTTNNKHRYVLTSEYPGIYLEKTGNRWVYPVRTFEQIDRIYSQVYPFGTDQLLNLLPKFGTANYLGLHLWQWLGIFLLTVITIFVYLICKFAFERFIYQLLKKYGYQDIARKHVLPVAKPFSLLAAFSVLLLLAPLVQLPITQGKYVMMAIRALLSIFGIMVVYRLIDLLTLYFEKLAAKTPGTLDDQLVILLRKVLKVVVVVIGGLFVLQNLNFNITALLTGISIGGLALALAAQDTLKNFFGSLMIFIDKPFQIGHWITSGEIDGTVEEVGFRSTRIRTFRNSLTYVPNAHLADSTIDNHGLRQYRRFYTQIAINYDTPPELIELFVEGLKKIVDQHPYTRKEVYEIHLNEFGDYALKIMFYIFFAVPTWSEELRCRHEVMLSVIRLAEKLGIKFAFPTQTLHMETFPGQESLSPQYNSNLDELKANIQHFLNKK